MSTYYYLVCDRCQERCDAASRAMGGPCMLGHSFALSQFIQRHLEEDCHSGVRLTSEYDEGIKRYSKPCAGLEDPRRKAEYRETELLDRVHIAEAEVRKLTKLYGGIQP